MRRAKNMVVALASRQNRKETIMCVDPKQE